MKECLRIGQKRTKWQALDKLAWTFRLVPTFGSGLWEPPKKRLEVQAIFNFSYLVFSDLSKYSFRTLTFDWIINMDTFFAQNEI